MDEDVAERVVACLGRNLARARLRPSRCPHGDHHHRHPFRSRPSYALWPFGRTLVPSETRHKGLSVFANVLWFVLVGWWLALEHLVVGVILCITIIGIPLGVGSFKMAGAALVPFGKEVVELSKLGSAPEGAIVLGSESEQ